MRTIIYVSLLSNSPNAIDYYVVFLQEIYLHFEKEILRIDGNNLLEEKENSTKMNET